MLEYQAGNSPLEARTSFPIGLFFLFLAIFAVILTVVYIIHKKHQTYLQSDSYKEKERNRLTTKKDINFIVKENNLTPEQGDMLWEICQLTESKNIIYQLKDNNDISALFQKAYNIFKERNDSDDKLFDFFILLYKMETIVAKNKAVTNTKFIPISTVIFFLNGGEQLPFPLIKNTEDSFYLEIPEFLYNSPRRPKILARSRFTFKTNQGLSYNFVARIMRYENNTPGQFLMVVGHTDNLQSQIQRHYKRDYFERKCSFSPIQISKDDINGDHYIYSPKKYDGSVTNLSAGGCCIQTDMPIKEGQHLRVFIPDLNTNENIIGVIKKTRRLPITGYAIHIQFLRISIKSQNRIFSLVYKYEI